MKYAFALLLMTLASPALADSFTIIRDGQEYLCQSTVPGNPGGAARCADVAYQGPFTRDESIRLCAGARNEAPARCGILAYQGPFTRDESVRLCSRTGTMAIANCAIQAYNGPYTREEAIALCRDSKNPELITRSLKLIASSKDVQEKVKNYKREAGIEEAAVK